MKYVFCEEAFPDHHHCRNIAGYRQREGLTPKELSEKTGIPQSHISAIENNRHPIGKKIRQTSNPSIEC